ncbi:MAG: hypothetical protein ABMB14_21020, partial [Myxococcota bacterium]
MKPKDPVERIVAATTRGIYESHYLRCNEPSGERALWIKHNALVPVEGAGIGEFWAIAFRRGEPPIVVKREVVWSDVEAAPDAIRLRCGSISLDPGRSVGSIAHLGWDLRLTDGHPPLFHLPYASMYTGSFPKKKLLTPAPNLRFDGVFTLGSETWAIDGWIGARGHNWGTEHAHAYAYGGCNLWDDGVERAVDGFSASILLGGRPTPWLTAVVGTDPFVSRNRPRHWLGSGTVAPGRWTAKWWRPGGPVGGPPVSLELVADPEGYAGLRYRHP